MDNNITKETVSPAMASNFTTEEPELTWEECIASIGDVYRSQFQYILHFYLTPITSSVGFCTSFLCLLVFSAMKTNNSATFMLKVVSVVDCVNLVQMTVFPHSIDYFWCMGSDIVLVLVYTFTGSLHLIPYWMVLILSADRWVSKYTKSNFWS